MIITRNYAMRLVRAGKATIEDCCTIDSEGAVWQIVTRHDLLRVDHFRALCGNAGLPRPEPRQIGGAL